MGPRKQPPHHVEVEAVEQNIFRICHKIYLPNNTDEVSPGPRNSGPAAQSKFPPHGPPEASQMPPATAVLT